MKKKIITIITLIILSFAPAFAAIDANQCDGLKTKAKKIDCLSALKAKAIKESALEPLKKINAKLNSFDSKKKKFDEKNKTLWDMFKNRK